MFDLTKNSMESGWRENLAVFAGILFLVVLTYGHTLHVPWYMDDVRAIVENRDVHSLREALANLFTANRGIADLTFALNYRFGGDNVFGYHLVNIAIHLASSFLVFLLFKRIFRERLLLAVGGALIFAAHPLQTQAITYIVQRMTSLSALFFLLALYLYVRAREVSSLSSASHWGFYAGGLLCGALAVLIKQNTAVLPVAILLFDRYFLPAEQRLPWQKLSLYLVPFLIAPGLLAVRSFLLPMLAEGGIANLGGMPELMHLRHSSPINYLVTEFSVLWIYLKLLFVPYGQALDYDYPIVATIWAWKSLVALLGLLALLSAAAFLRRKQPLVSAGIFWFFLALSVESTIIPLDPVFEHRLYLPMLGFALVVMAGFSKLPRKSAIAGILALVAVLGGLTWQRNNLWNDPIAFHEDNLRRAPRSERVHLDLANAYRKEGRLAEAQEIYEKALEINPDYVLIHINLSMVYAAQKQHQKAVDILLEGIQRNSGHFKLYNNIGVLYNFLGRYDEAAAHLQKGAMLKPHSATVHFNLALAQERLGRLEEAIHNYRRAIDLDSSDPMSHFNLGLALYRKGDPRQALEAFLAATRLNPSHTGTLFNAAMVSLEIGDRKTAGALASRLQQLDPVKARQFQQHFQQQVN